MACLHLLSVVSASLLLFAEANPRRANELFERTTYDVALGTLHLMLLLHVLLPGLGGEKRCTVTRWGCSAPISEMARLKNV